MRHRGIRSVILAGLFLAFGIPGAVFGGEVVFRQTNLITSAQDPDLINPWGISYGATSPFWVSDNGTGKSTLYNGAGAKQGLIVNMPNADPITGQVFSGNANAFNGNFFIFASEAGTIDGWRPALSPITEAENLFTTPGAVYKGLAISTAKDTLYAANFNNGKIDVFNSAGMTGSFSDPNTPSGYAPFNIQNIGGTFYVTFAKQDVPGNGHDDVKGTGHGFVDVFDPTTNTFTRLITGSDAGGTDTHLDSPWGLALAPSTFGQFAGDLLVGNFGDGKINVFDPTSGGFLGTLSDEHGNPLVNPGLWGLIVGNGGQGGSPDSLYFTAGGADEGSGLFARIDAIPEPSTLALGLIAIASVAAGSRWRVRSAARPA